MVDNDGTFSHSQIESVSFDRSGTAYLYPNPSPKGYVKLDVNGLKVDAITVYDLSGRKIEIQARMTGNGDHELDFSRAASGVYTIVISYEGGAATRKQVVL
ncbi:MAG: hypothetical protein ABS46_01475 [Cytophagaceae bacterium SCN 52-12]|nr:MAG: hypothetical protein ABS46_01475 [Cytophagaceae bacterium SCN 52-12]